MGTDEFIEEAFKEADQMDIDRLKANADVAKLIKSSKNAVDSIDVDGVIIRFQSFIPLELRKRIQAEKPDGDSESVLYFTLAKLCLDDPWNKEITWKYLEANGGDASEYLAKIMGKITARAKQMRSFQ